MIRVLGAKRILTLAILLALNGLVAAVLYLYLTPEHMSKQNELSALRGKMSTVQSDIGRMQIEFTQLSAQQDEFNKLKAHGFFTDQGRREAELILEKIQTQAGVVSAVANIGRGTAEDNAEAEKAEHKILVSPMNINISAVDDIDVYRYIYLLEHYFPGHVAIQKLSLERVADVSGTVLRSIASNENPQLVKAEIDLLWRTMIPAKDVIGATTGAPQ